MIFHKARITNIEHPIKDVMTFSFIRSSDDNAELQYYPGQHVILRFFDGGEEIRRPYALTSSPFTNEQPSLAINEVKGGKLSGYIFEHADEGTEIEVSEAQGFFYADINSEQSQTYFLFAVGMGIAPIYSILKSVLHAEIVSRVYLYYECKDRDSILYYNELAILQREYSNRLTIIYSLSSPGILPSIKPWVGEKGKINKKRIDAFLKANPEDAQQANYFICAAQDQNDLIKTALQQSGISDLNIHCEQYLSKAPNKTVERPDQPVQISLHHSLVNMEGNMNQTILDTLKANMASAPFACESGNCGTCAVKLQEGEVDMQSHPALEADDIENGWILTCQAFPNTADIKLKME